MAYTYTSSVDLVAHPNAGLIGVLVIGAPGELDRWAAASGRLRPESGVRGMLGGMPGAVLLNTSGAHVLCSCAPAPSLPHLLCAAHVPLRRPSRTCCVQRQRHPQGVESIVPLLFTPWPPSPPPPLPPPPCSTSGTPKGVDSIVPLLFTILDEGASPLLPDSMKVCAGHFVGLVVGVWGAFVGSPGPSVQPGWYMRPSCITACSSLRPLAQLHCNPHHYICFRRRAWAWRPPSPQPGASQT